MVYPKTIYEHVFIKPPPAILTEFDRLVRDRSGSPVSVRATVLLVDCEKILLSFELPLENLEKKEA